VEGVFGLRPGSEDDRAYSLMEVILGIGLMGVALLSLVALLSSGLRLKTRLTQVTVATELARTTLERTKSLGFAALPISGSFFDGSVYTPQTGSGFPPSPYPAQVIDSRQYVVNVWVNEVVGRARLKNIIVQVSWAERSKVVLSTRVLDL
jgi:type II secretory pathway pseudopilin PulG